MEDNPRYLPESCAFSLDFSLVSTGEATGKNVLQSLPRGGLRAQAASWPQGSQNLGSGILLLSFPHWLSILQENSCTRDASPACGTPRDHGQRCSHSLISRDNYPPVLAARPGQTWQEQQPGGHRDEALSVWGCSGRKGKDLVQRLWNAALWELRDSQVGVPNPR